MGKMASSWQNFLYAHSNFIFLWMYCFGFYLSFWLRTSVSCSSKEYHWYEWPMGNSSTKYHWYVIDFFFHAYFWPKRDREKYYHFYSRVKIFEIYLFLISIALIQDPALNQSGSFSASANSIGVAINASADNFNVSFSYSFKEDYKFY